MNTSSVTVRAGQVAHESDDAPEPASNGGTQDQENTSKQFGTVAVRHKTKFTLPLTDWSNLHSVGDLLRGIGRFHG